MKPAPLGHVDETPAIVTKNVVDGPFVFGWITVEAFPALILADRGMVRVPANIMTDIKVEVAIVVEVGKG